MTADEMRRELHPELHDPDECPLCRLFGFAATVENTVGEVDGMITRLRELIA